MDNLWIIVYPFFEPFLTWISVIVLCPENENITTQLQYVCPHQVWIPCPVPAPASSASPCNIFTVSGPTGVKIKPRSGWGLVNTKIENVLTSKYEY